MAAAFDGTEPSGQLRFTELVGLAARRAGSSLSNLISGQPDSLSAERMDVIKLPFGTDGTELPILLQVVASRGSK
jgi:hypothetical protein